MIRDKAIARLGAIEAMIADSDELFAACAFERAAEYANSAGDSAEACCAAFDGLADCLRGALNAHPDECERWEEFADNAARWVNTAERLYADCVNLID